MLGNASGTAPPGNTICSAHPSLCYGYYNGSDVRLPTSGLSGTLPTQIAWLSRTLQLLDVSERALPRTQNIRRHTAAARARVCVLTLVWLFTTRSSGSTP